MKRIQTVKETSSAANLLAFVGVAVIIISGVFGFAISSNSGNYIFLIVSVIIGVILSLPIFAAVSIIDDIHATAWNSSIIAAESINCRRALDYIAETLQENRNK